MNKHIEEKKMKKKVPYYFIKQNTIANMSLIYDFKTLWTEIEPVLKLYKNHVEVSKQCIKSHDNEKDWRMHNNYSLV